MVHLCAKPLMAVHSRLSWLFRTQAHHQPYQPYQPCKAHHDCLLQLVRLGAAGLLAVHPGVPRLLRRISHSTSRTPNSTDPDWKLRELVPVGAISFLAVHPRLPQLLKLPPG